MREKRNKFLLHKIPNEFNFRNTCDDGGDEDALVLMPDDLPIVPCFW